MSLTPLEFEQALNEARQAHSVRPFRCLNPDCLRTHIALLDEQGRPFAHFVVPDAWVFAVAGQGSASSN
jgi:hypothetical protein